MTPKVAALHLLFFGLSACASQRDQAGSPFLPPRAPDGPWHLPDRKANYSEHQPARPADRQAAIDREFREAAGNYHREHSGLDALRYPSTRSLRYAWGYAALGDDYAREGATGAAAQAYWAALGMASNALGSRPDRERLRQHCLLKLATLAELRGERRWSALLRFAGDLAASYLESAAAERDQGSFYANLEGMQQAERQAFEARREALAGIERQRLANMASSMNVQSGIASGALGLDQALQQVAGVVVDSIGTEMQAGAVNQAMLERLESLGADAGQLKEVAAKDLPEISAGKSFVGQQLLFYVAANESDAGRYLDRFLRFAGEDAELARLAAVPKSRQGAVEVAARIAKGLQEAEIYVATFERNSAAPGPKYLNDACQTGSVRCGLASRDLCAKGVGVACDRYRSGLEDGCRAMSASHCRVLGTALVKGPLPERDVQRGRSLLSQGCDREDPLSCATLAVVLAETGTTASTKARSRWAHERACALGVSDSCER